MFYYIMKVQLQLAYEGLSRSAEEDFKEMKWELARVLSEHSAGYLVQPVPVYPRNLAVGGAVPAEVWAALIAGASAVGGAAITAISVIVTQFVSRHKDVEVSISIENNSYSIKGRSVEEILAIIEELHTKYQQVTPPQQIDTTQSQQELDSVTSTLNID